MLGHVLRLIWNRRRVSRLVIVEVAAAFLVVFVVSALALHAWGNYRRPLGFNYENIWRVGVAPESAAFQPGMKPDALRASMDDIVQAVRQIPGVIAAHRISATPFMNMVGISGLGRENAQIPTQRDALSAEAVKDLGVRVVAGRSYGPEDEGQEYRAVLVNREFVKRAFGGASPLGQRINFTTKDRLSFMTPEQARIALREIRVVGIIDDFRQNGEFTEPTPYAIYSESNDDYPATDLFVHVAPGTDRRLEEKIVATVRATARGFGAGVAPWEELRATYFLDTLLPLRIGATLAIFLLAMVALGLIGIVWQDVVRRTQEIGVRRAAGASVRAVRGQILLEILTIAGAGIVIGSVLAIQIPLLAIVKQIDWAAALPALGVSAALILLLAAAAALYPAFLASRREPADALRYE